MGFIRNMLDEAGKKTGSAIGNRLFPRFTDYIRLGDEPGTSEKDRRREERRAVREQMEMEQQTNQMNSLLNITFLPNDIDHNIASLAHVAAILDSLPSSYFARSLDEDKIYKLAKSKMEIGLMMCKSIDPYHPMVSYFEQKYQ